MFKQCDIDDLKAAIASGALEVQFANGQKTTYRSLREMREILRMMQDEVSATPAVPNSRSFVAAL